jgi:hypothetical protein
MQCVLIIITKDATAAELEHTFLGTTVWQFSRIKRLSLGVRPDSRV